MTRSEAINKSIYRQMSDYDITKREALASDEVKLINTIFDDFELEKIENKD